MSFDKSSYGATRRVMLLGVGFAGFAGTMTACGSSGSSGDSGSSNNSGSSGNMGGSTSALGSASSIPVGGGKIFMSQKVVVTQPTAGQYKAFSAVCTHAGCTVNRISGGKIYCPCHGSVYNVSDGSVAHGPAKAPLPGKKVTVQNGQVMLA